MNKSIAFAILLVAHCSYGQMGVHPESAAAPACKFGGLAATGSPTDAKARKEKRATPPPSTPTGTALSPVQEKRATPKNSPKALQPIQLNVPRVGNQRFNVIGQPTALLQPALVQEDDEVTAAVTAAYDNQKAKSEHQTVQSVVAPVLVQLSPTAVPAMNRAMSAQQLATPAHDQVMTPISLQRTQSYVYGGPDSQGRNTFVAPAGNAQHVSQVDPAAQQRQPVAYSEQLEQAVQDMIGEGYLDMQHDNQSDASLVKNDKDKAEIEIKNEILRRKCIQLLKNPSKDVQTATEKTAKIRKREVPAEEIINEAFRRGYFRINFKAPTDDVWPDLVKSSREKIKKKTLSFNQKLSVEEAVEKAIKRLQAPSDAIDEEAKRIKEEFVTQALRIENQNKNPAAQAEAKAYLKMSEQQRYNKALEYLVQKLHRKKIWKITQDLLTEEEWNSIVTRANQGCCVIL